MKAMRAGITCLNIGTLILAALPALVLLAEADLGGIGGSASPAHTPPSWGLIAGAASLPLVAAALVLLPAGLLLRREKLVVALAWSLVPYLIAFVPLPVWSRLFGPFLG